MHVEKQRRISSVYIKQPKRTKCKNCDFSLNSQADFVKDGIEYLICENCTHLNGAHEDTDEFCNVVYAGDEGEEYAQNYQVKNLENFNYRVSSIYIPKAEFLYTSLINDRVDPNQLKFLDFGAGSGYFLGALKKIGLNNVFGTEVSRYQVEFGNRMIGSDLLSVHALNETERELERVDADVVSLIGVLEHLQNPRGSVQSIQDNSRIKYLYISVPLFSLSVFLEMLSVDVYHRQLHGGHTHLYTEKSLQYLADEYGFEIASEWWFGTDMVDLYRNIHVHMENNDCSSRLINSFKEMMLPVIDSAQLEFDKKHLSSEVHILLKRK